MRGLLEMRYRLAENVRARQESWGLLFYSRVRHKVTFIRSGNWLRPEHFNGDWSTAEMIFEISTRTGAPVEVIERYLPGLIERLAAGRLITDEVH